MADKLTLLSATYKRSDDPEDPVYCCTRPMWRLTIAITVLTAIALVPLLTYIPQPSSPGICPGSATNYTLTVDFLADDAFSELEWRYFTDTDPTGGPTQYMGHTDVEELGLLQKGDGWAVLRAGERIGSGRRSFRVESRRSWQQVLLQLGYAHVPHGCGVWPAIWLHCADADRCKPWPENGELDLIEYANEFYTKSSLHLGRHAQCSLDSSALAACGPFMDKNSMRYNCATDYFGFPPRYGCAPNRADEWAAPAQLNAQPATLVAELTTEAIKVFNFPAGQEPADLLAGAPEPSGWDPKWLWSYYPLAESWCPSQSELRPLNVILNIAFCGDWAGGDWKRPLDDGSMPTALKWLQQKLSGDAVTCASLHGMAGRRTNREACDAYVLSEASDTAIQRDAFFNITAFRVYEQQPEIAPEAASGEY